MVDFSEGDAASLVRTEERNMGKVQGDFTGEFKWPWVSVRKVGKRTCGRGPPSHTGAHDGIVYSLFVGLLRQQENGKFSRSQYKLSLHVS